MIYTNYYCEAAQDVEEFEQMLETYKKYGDCGRRSSGELARLENKLAEMKEELACIALGC